MVVLEFEDMALTLRESSFPSYRLNIQTRVRHSISGIRRTNIWTPSKTEQTISVSITTKEKYYEFVTFIKRARGQQIVFTDSDLVSKNIRIINDPQLKLVSRNHWEVSIKFEDV